MLLSNTTSLLSQVLIQIVDASSVITWDFDVCKGDIVFNIFHSKRAPQPPKKDSLGAHSITSPGGNNVQLIDKVWQLGRDYSMVESPLICKEGESVQVSPPNPCAGADGSQLQN